MVRSDGLYNVDRHVSPTMYMYSEDRGMQGYTLFSEFSDFFFSF